MLNDLVTYGPAESHFAQDCVSGRWSVVTCVREETRRGQWRTGPYYECFVTDHLHAQIHAPLDEKAFARLPADPTLDAPPRAAALGDVDGAARALTATCFGRPLTPKAAESSPKPGP